MIVEFWLIEIREHHSVSRRKQTRREKRRGRKNFQMAESEITSVEQQKLEKDNILGASAEELKALQEADPTLAAVREAVVGVENDQSGSFFKNDGLLYRRRKQAAGGGGEDLDGEQLVLPKEFRKSVLNLAHSVPTAGHLGKKKTVDRILLAGSVPRCDKLLQELRRISEGVWS